MTPRSKHHQAHQQVDAALGDHGQADQLAGQLAPECRVLGAEQAVVGQVERLRDGERVPRVACLAQQPQDPVMRAVPVVVLPLEPDAQPQRRRRGRVEQRQRP
ncbi:hypothetical protein ACI2LC_01115 [Nonomuraea wenchangensis]|uniref:hypothetical protein n=1 Tax=Nonomuraea wenchangensis TaxID=568860 RepID=UPI00384AF3D0